jgi:flagellar biosynthesis/type III secretory pathway protein FliH
MPAERVIEWTQQWKEEGLREGRREGLQEGLQEGRQQGLAAERALLTRQARRRFGEACAEALASLLERCTETEGLAEVGEWIVTCDSAEALLDRARMHIA